MWARIFFKIGLVKCLVCVRFEKVLTCFEQELEVECLVVATVDSRLALVCDFRGAAGFSVQHAVEGEICGHDRSARAEGLILT